MLITQLCINTDERSGDWYYRTHMPGRSLAGLDDVWVADVPYKHRAANLLAREADVLVVNMVADESIVPLLIWRRLHGRVNVMEINDDVTEIWTPREVEALRKVAAECHGVQFSTQSLADKYRGVLDVSNRRVFLNMIGTPAPRNEIEGVTVVGWGGSFRHITDLEPVAKPLTDWINTTDNVLFACMADYRIHKLFDGVKRDRFCPMSLGTIDDYYQFLASLDIGIAPLQDTALNRSRSDIKFLEYAAHGAMPVVQAFGPYEKYGVYSFRDGELVSALAWAVSGGGCEFHKIHSPTAQLVSDRSESRCGPERLEFYRGLMMEAETDSDDVKRLFDTINPLSTSRHLSLRFGDSERSHWSKMKLGIA